MFEICFAVTHPLSEIAVLTRGDARQRLNGDAGDGEDKGRMYKDRTGITLTRSGKGYRELEDRRTMRAMEATYQWRQAQLP
jgi:hypothetical protein